MMTYAQYYRFIKGAIIAPLFFLMLSCSTENKDSEVDCGDNQGALILNHNGLNREYLVYLPQDYNASESLPVVFNLHGYGGYAMDHLASTSLTQMLRTCKIPRT